MDSLCFVWRILVILPILTVIRGQDRKQEKSGGYKEERYQKSPRCKANGVRGKEKGARRWTARRQSYSGWELLSCSARISPSTSSNTRVTVALPARVGHIIRELRERWVERRCRCRCRCQDVDVDVDVKMSMSMSMSRCRCRDVAGVSKVKRGQTANGINESNRCQRRRTGAGFVVFEDLPTR